jgi:hypothetical protein
MFDLQQKQIDNVKSLAAFLNCSVPLIRKLCKDPAFPLLRVGTALRFDRQREKGSQAYKPGSNHPVPGQTWNPSDYFIPPHPQ